MRLAAPIFLLLLAAGICPSFAQAEELLPFFAGDTALSAKEPWANRDDASHRWDGLTMGTEVFAGGGVGKGARGGFGGDLNVGYLKELDNNIVVGVGAAAGYAPSFSRFVPKGYNFGMADVKVGYDMGKFMPYVTMGVGRMGAAAGPGGWQGLDSVNNVFASKGPAATVTKVGAGFTYEVAPNLHIGAEISTVQMRGNGFGPPPQPGALP